MHFERIYKHCYDYGVTVSDVVLVLLFVAAAVAVIIVTIAIAIAIHALFCVVLCCVAVCTVVIRSFALSHTYTHAYQLICIRYDSVFSVSLSFLAHLRIAFGIPCHNMYNTTFFSGIIYRHTSV